MNSHKTISFVVPAYNEENHLARTLTAIIAEVQRTACQAEIIVVNNASTDGTGSLAASFPEVIVVDEPEKGLVQARRAGFLRAGGDLIANVDADTIVTEGWLERVLEEFCRHPRLVALSGPYIYYDTSKATRVAVRAFYCMGYAFYILSQFVLRTGSMLQGGNFVVRRTGLGGDRRLQPAVQLLRRGHRSCSSIERCRRGEVHLPAAGAVLGQAAGRRGDLEDRLALRDELRLGNLFPQAVHRQLDRHPHRSLT